MGRTKRIRLFKGIYQSGDHVSIVVSVAGKPREFRHDGDGKPYSRYERHTLPDERKRVEARERLKVERATVAAGTFRADVTRYLKTLASESHRRNSRGYLAHWDAAFADRHRNDLTELDVQHAFAAITKKPSTKNHIRHALIDFYRTLNGRHGYNPALILKKVREHYDDARALSYDVIEQIFAHLDPTPTKARLMIMAYTGLPPAQIELITPHDLHLHKHAVYVRPRRKGAGVEGRMIPLSAKGIAAFQLFASLHAYGTFQRKQLQRTFARGITLAGVSTPEGTRPYDLRHSFLTEVYRQTGDLKAVSELGLHATLEQTGRYARGAVSERATKAITAVPRFGATTRMAQRSKAPTNTHIDRQAATAPTRRRQRAKSRRNRR
jgi:integrase